VEKCRISGKICRRERKKGGNKMTGDTTGKFGKRHERDGLKGHSRKKKKSWEVEKEKRNLDPK